MGPKAAPMAAAPLERPERPRGPNPAWMTDDELLDWALEQREMARRAPPTRPSAPSSRPSSYNVPSCSRSSGGCDEIDVVAAAGFAGVVFGGFD